MALRSVVVIFIVVEKDNSAIDRSRLCTQLAIMLFIQDNPFYLQNNLRLFFTGFIGYDLPHIFRQNLWGKDGDISGIILPASENIRSMVLGKLARNLFRCFRINRFLG